MLSFIEYASEKRILELLIKERVKAALKGKLKDVMPSETIRKTEQEKSLTTAEQISLLMPSRNSWRWPQKKDRVQKDGKEKKSEKQILTRCIATTIKIDRKSPDKHPYLERLNSFIEQVRNDITGNAPLEFSSIRITGKVKKVDAEGTTILRPICIFESLREKILIALASKYLSEIFAPLLHEEILSYRPLRRYHNSAEPVLTDRDNAIENLQAYRNAHKRETIYVAECDIQKYFDTINHDVIRRCFSKFAQKLQALYPDFEYAHVGRIVEAYLNSYSFYKNVVVENEKLMNGESPRKYESPKDELFIERGCYTAEEFNRSTGKIGIPQGGALSGLISNIVLCTVDQESILAKPDGKRFFCRYGDDIMLMHTSKDECNRLIKEYCNSLTKNKLLYHEFVSVADKKFRRENGATRPLLWDQKSRSPFLWGRSNTDKECVDWIGFLGYEIRYTGEVRMRRSSLNEKFKSIKRRYRTGAKTKVAKGEFKKELDKEIINRIERFKSDGLITAKSLTRNKYSTTQALKLNSYASRWQYRLLYKIAKRNNLPADATEKWWQTAKECGCINYLKTISKR